MKTLKNLLEEVKAYNLDTDEELDLDALADLNLDDLLGLDGDGEFGGDELPGDDVGELDFNDDLMTMNLDDYQLDNVDSEDEFDLELDGDLDSEFGDDELDLEDSEFGDEELDLEDGEFGEEGEGFEEENPDFQGAIRTVRGANLVYKRKTEDGNFEELWIYNIGKDIKKETQIRRAILAGTDIDPSSQESDDGEQRADTTTTGNVQFLHITGLPQ